MGHIGHQVCLRFIVKGTSQISKLCYYNVCRTWNTSSTEGDIRFTIRSYVDNLVFPLYAHCNLQKPVLRVNSVLLVFCASDGQPKEDKIREAARLSNL
jgi:hypothetical protein